MSKTLGEEVGGGGDRAAEVIERGHFGGIRPPSPPRHDTTAPEEPRLRARIYPLIFISLLRTFDPHVFKRVLVYFPLLFRLSGGFFPFSGSHS